MRRQRNMVQMKEKNQKTPEKELNKMEIKQSIRCRVQNTVIRMLKELSEDSAA